MIAPIDQDDLCIAVSQCSRRSDPSEAAADDYDTLPLP
jgi:hypothetical protein